MQNPLRMPVANTVNEVFFNCFFFKIIYDVLSLIVSTRETLVSIIYTFLLSKGSYSSGEEIVSKIN